MIALKPRHSRACRILTVIWVWFAVSTRVGGAQEPVTLDFDYLRPLPPDAIPADWGLPWVEDGYTVAGSPATVSFELLTARTGPPPYRRVLEIISRNQQLSTVTIVNNAGSPFDLLALDLLGPPVAEFPSPSDLVVVTSSAGGMFDLRGIPVETAIQFSGSQWQNLSYVKVMLSADGIFGGGGIRLDNFVLQASAVPEPSALFIGVWGATLLLWRTSAGRRRAENGMSSAGSGGRAKPAKRNCARMSTRSRWLRWLFSMALLVCCSCDLHEKIAVDQFSEGVKQYEAGNYSAAIANFSGAIGQNPKSADSCFYRGICKFSLKDCAGAITDFNKVIELEPDNVRAFTDRGLAKHGLADYDGALADLNQAISLGPDAPEAYNARGITLTLLRNLDAAIVDFTRAIELNPEEATAYRNRAGAEVLIGEFERAMADSSRAIELDGKDGFSYRIRGHAKSSLKDFRGALLDFNRAIELSPADGEAYAGRGGIKLLAEDLTGAGADLEKAVALNPGSAAAFAGRGFLRKKQGDNPAALADFQKAVELGSRLAETHQSLAYVQNDLLLFRPALENFRKTLEMDPSKDYVRMRIWLIRSRLGEREAADQELGDYVKSLPEAKAEEWPACIERFLSGNLPESEFFNQATATARRESAIGGQKCEAFYYVGMKRLLAGDKEGAAKLFQQCLDSGEKNYTEYMSAGAELRALKKP